MLLLFLALPALTAASCIGNSSYLCLSSKLSKAVYRINSIPEIPVTGWLSLVRENRDWEGRESKEPQGLLEVVGQGIDTFLETRSLRFTLPSWARADRGKVDIDLIGAVQLEEGRKRGGKKGHGMGMMMMAMMGKMAMMSMGIIKMKAMKALIIGTIALVLSKLQLFKLLTSQKGGGGGESHVIVLSDGGGHGGGHGGGGGGGGHGGGAPVHVVHESYGPPSGGWNGGGGGGGGDSWGGGGGGGHGGWSSGSGGGGGGHGGWSSGGGGGGGGAGGWSSGGGGGWGKRSYANDDTYTISPVGTKNPD